jgi:hypothetical protein
VKAYPLKRFSTVRPFGRGSWKYSTCTDHPKASRVYAWTNETGDPKNSKHHVTVLHLGPVTSAIHAVRAAIVQEFRSLEPAEEN